MVDQLESIELWLAVMTQLSRRTIFGSYALAVYEFLIVFDAEIVTIHKSKWSLLRALYYGCRFGPLLLYPIVIYGLVGDHDEESCKPLIPLVTFCLNLFPCLPQCIFTLRAWAFMGAKRPMLLIFLPCLFAYIGVVVWAFWYRLRALEGLFLFGKAACIRELDHGSSPFLWMSYAGVALDVVIGLAMVVHCYRSYSSQSRIGKLLVEQGLLYYPVMILMNTVSAALTTIGKFPEYEVLVFFTSAIFSNLLACRFVIQIREHTSTEFNSTHLRSMVFRDLEARSNSTVGTHLTRRIQKPWDAIEL